MVSSAIPDFGSNLAITSVSYTIAAYSAAIPRHTAIPHIPLRNIPHLAKYGIYLIYFTTHCCLDCRIFFSNAKSAGLSLNKVMRWFIFTAALPSSPLSATTIITSDTHMHRNVANRAPHHHQCPTQPQGKMTAIGCK